MGVDQHGKADWTCGVGSNSPATTNRVQRSGYGQVSRPKNWSQTGAVRLAKVIGQDTSCCGVDVVIRTPDRRLRVFVSSTLGELAAERRAVAWAKAALRLSPVMFEAGARGHTRRASCTRLSSP